MVEWNFIKKDLEKFIKNGENLLQQNLSKIAKQEIKYEIKLLKRYINDNYSWIEEKYNNVSFSKAKEYYLKFMKKIYKELGEKTIKWFISLEQEGIFLSSVNNRGIILPIDVQKEYTLKNYERYSKVSLNVAKQIFSPLPTNQIQVCEELDDTSSSRFFRIADMPLIIINPDEGAAILNHEVEHAVESTISYNTHFFYKELGSIFYEILFNNSIYHDKSILPTERLEDFDLDIEILSDFFKLILEFAKRDFIVTDNEFKNICIKKLDVIPEEIEEWLDEEVEYDYEGMIQYTFSHLKAIELIRLVNKKTDTLELLEKYINTNKFIFETDIKKFKIYEEYIEEVKEKTLKR